MAHRPSPGNTAGSSSVLGSLTAAERSEVLAGLLVVRPDLAGEAERIASELLSSTSSDDVAAEVEAAVLWIPLDALAARAGRVRGRSYVHETDAAWELVEETVAPFLADLERRAALGLRNAATLVAVGIVTGLYRVREPEMGTVLACAGEDALRELATGILGRAAKLGVSVPDHAPGTYWPSWSDLW